MSLPCGMFDGLPVGMMLVAKPSTKKRSTAPPPPPRKGVDWKSLKAGA
jgi:hypothetical protein